MPIDRNPSGVLRIGGVEAVQLVQELDTPSYVYDVDAIAAGARDVRSAFEGAPHVAAYAVKANSAGAIVRALAREGCGADVVSGAELLVALACGIAPERVVYSGVGKTDDEIDRALSVGSRGIAAVQAESVEEIARIESRARASGRVAKIGLRLNPQLNMDGVTHSNIATGHDAAKFGIPRNDFALAVERAETSALLELVGLATHAGSQLSEVPYLDAARVLFGIASALRSEGRVRSLSFIDSGGGFGVDYDAAPPGASAAQPAAHPPWNPPDFVRAVRREQLRFGLSDLTLFVEPGRSLVARHGVLLSKVVQPKVTSTGRWLIIDAGMNDLMRPALYQARHRIVPIDRAVDRSDALEFRVVGPVCESSDDFGSHMLPADPPTAVAILDAGAYGFAMANVYNGRPVPVEGFVEGGRLVSRTTRASATAWVQDRVRAGTPNL